MARKESVRRRIGDLDLDDGVMCSLLRIFVIVYGYGDRSKSAEEMFRCFWRRSLWLWRSKK